MEKAMMKENFKKNYPHIKLPPESWFDLTDEERLKATDAPVSWRFGILPSEESKRLQ